MKNTCRLLGYFGFLVLCLVLSTSSHAQVTAQITDAGGQSWNNGTWSVQLVYTPGATNPTAPFLVAGTTTPVPNQMQSGTLNSSGNLSVNLTINAGIDPGGTAWRFQVCPQASSPCFVNTITITSANQVVTAFLVPPAISINAFTTAAPILAYADSEIATAPLGFSYWNVTAAVNHTCSVLTGSVCTWIVSSGLPAGPTAPNGVAQTLCETPSGGVAGAAGFCLSGVPTNAQTGVSYTIAATDRNGYVTTSNAGAIAVTLPQAGSGGGTNNDFTHNFTYRECNIGAGTATITPTTSTISYTTTASSTYTSAAASLPLTTNQCASIFSDNTNYFANVYALSSFPAVAFTSTGTTAIGSNSSALSGANVIRVESYHFDTPINANTIEIHVNTGDNSANLYDFGIYSGCSNGGTATLVAHVGAASYTTTGIKMPSLTGGAVTLNPGWYCFAWTGNATVLNINFSSAGNRWSRFADANSVSTSSGGVLPATITAPADSFAQNSTAYEFSLYTP